MSGSMANRFPGLFDEPVIDMTAGPTLQAPSGVTWSKDVEAPVSGVTPAARNASASGAQAASTWRNSYAQRLLLHFYKHPQKRLTIAEAAVLMGIKEGSITGPWNHLEHKLGWIVGTGENHTYTTASGLTVHREYHTLTAEGRSAAIALDFNKTRQETGCSD